MFAVWLFIVQYLIVVRSHLFAVAMIVITSFTSAVSLVFEAQG